MDFNGFKIVIYKDHWILNFSKTSTNDRLHHKLSHHFQVPQISAITVSHKNVSLQGGAYEKQGLRTQLRKNGSFRGPL